MKLRSVFAALHAALLCILLAASPAGSGSMTLLGAGKVGGGGGVTFSLSWVSHAEDTIGGTTVTYSTLSFGTADTNRVIAVGVANRSGSTATVASMTIGGISATQVPSALGDTGSGFWATDVWYAPVPTGISGNVAVTYTNASIRSGIDLYRIITTTPAPSAANGAFNPTPGTDCAQATTLTIPTGGAAMTLYGLRAQSPGGTNVSFTNATLDQSQNNIGGVLTTVGSGNTQTTGSTTITGKVVGSTGNIVAQSSAAWGP